MALTLKPRLLARASIITAAAILALIVTYRFDIVSGAGAPPASVREFPIPTTHGFPHDPAVDRAGRVYFTEINANKIGRLDPVSGRCDEFAVPSADSGPHGIVVGGDGWVTFTENRAGKIGRFDPQAESFTTTLAIPTPGAVVRNMDVAPDGRVWMALSGVDRLGVILE